MKVKKNKLKFLKAIVFTQWSRKGFALFSILDKIVIIAFLSVVYHLPANALNSQIKLDTTEISKHIGLEEIEVSAQRAPVAFSQVARIIRVIDKKEIEAAPVQNIIDLLRYVESIDIRQRGGEGVQADISLRGGSFDHVMILLNGIDITDPQTGHHNLNLPISLHQVERIEVIKGPASRVFGPNAFSGAINFITKESEKNNISLVSTLGSFGYMGGNIAGTVKLENSSHYISGGRKSSSGYIKNTDFENYNLFYKLDAGKNNNLSFQGGYSKKSFGANSFYTPKYPDQYEETNTYFSSLKWESKTKLNFTPAIFWRRHTDEFQLFRREAPSWYSSHNYHRTDVYGININGWINTILGKSAFGVNFRSENILSNVLGKPTENSITVKNENAVYTKSDSRNIYSVFFEQNYYSEKFSISGGVMANFISGAGLGVKFFPGIDLAYEISGNLKLYTTFNRSLRMPTFTDLYYNGPTNTGNPDLIPETATSVEAGLKFVSGFIQGNVSVFSRKGENIIDWVKLENEEKWHTENLTELNNSGIEINFDFNPESIFGDEFIIKDAKISYSYFDQSKNSDLYISNYALDNLKHKLDFSFTHYIFSKIQATWSFQYHDRNSTYTEFKNNEYGSEVEYQPFSLFNGKFFYMYNEFNLFISATNIFNTHYFDIGNLHQPGRWLKAGVSFNMDF